MRAVEVGPRTEPPRVAFSAGRAVGNAVVRNRTRRQLRAAVHEHAAALRPGSAYLVRALPGAAGSSYRELSNAFGAILGQFGDVSS